MTIELPDCVEISKIKKNKTTFFAKRKKKFLYLKKKRLF